MIQNLQRLPATMIIRTLLVMLAASLWSAAARAAGGEDFPFLCRVNDGERSGTAFLITPDLESETGYTLKLYRRWRFVARIPVQITDTDDRRYWIINGRARQNLNLFMDDMVLAYLAKDSERLSHAAVQTGWHNETEDRWNLQPVICGRL